MAGIADVALLDNTEERTPLVLVLDRSGSMAEEDRISALNQGLKTLEEELKTNGTTATRGRVLVIQFGGNDEVDVGQWQDAMDFTAPTLVAHGRTPTGSAVRKALEAIEAQKQELKDHHIKYKRPIMLLMSDGEPTDNWESAADACRLAETKCKVNVLAIGVGKDADINNLARFSQNGALKLDGLKFKELFVWLSASVSSVSQAAEGQAANLPSTGTFASFGTSTN